MAPKLGNSSAIGALLRGLTLLMPSTETESMLGLAPATERLPLESVCTPACVVSVEIGLVDPEPRDAIAIGRSSSSLPCLALAMAEVSVVITASAAAFTFTVSCLAGDGKRRVHAHGLARLQRQVREERACEALGFHRDLVSARLHVDQREVAGIAGERGLGARSYPDSLR